MTEPIIVTRAITLTEPWASLMAYDEKRIETRGRRTNYRGWVAIHAAQSMPAEARLLCGRDPFMACLTRHGIHNGGDFWLGYVIAVTRLVACWETKYVVDMSRRNVLQQRGLLEKSFEEPMREVTANELAFGDYGLGRFGYLTVGVRRLREPIPMRGNQAIPWKMTREITEADLV